MKKRKPKQKLKIWTNSMVVRKAEIIVEQHFQNIMKKGHKL